MGKAPAVGLQRYGARLFEREGELESLDAAIAAAVSGESALVMVEGAPGIGKTRLLFEARARAAATGLVALSARSSELEREFAFGVVRQLFEANLVDPSAREQALAGPATAVRRIFEAASSPAGDGMSAGDDPSFASLNGVYWLVVNLSAQRPLMIAVDDLQWCDRPSLRCLAYLVRRLPGLPVLIVGSARPWEPRADDSLLAELATDPVSLVIRPRPLSQPAVAAFVSERLRAEADEEFSAACKTATGGNPLLLVELSKALAAERVTPDADHVRVVADIGPRAVSRAVLLRLARLGDEALAVARAVAVLGDGAQPPLVAAIADLDDDRSAAGVHVLLEAEILRQPPDLGFTHPVVAAAVYQDIPPPHRGREHLRAARLLSNAGAAVQRVAAHLLAVPPSADGWVADVMVEAAQEAMQAGAADSAVTYLERALAEPPVADQRARVVLALGRAELHTRGLNAARHLTEAYELLDDPVQRAAAVLALARALLLIGQAPAGAAIAARAAAELPADQTELHTALRCAEAMAATVSGEATGLNRRQSPWPGASGDGVAGKMVATMVARGRTFSGGSSEQCARLASHALAGGELIAADNGFAAIVAITTLARADRDEALAGWEEALAEAQRRGSLQAKAGISLGLGFTLYRRGELPDAELWLRTALDEYALWGRPADAPMRHCLALLSLVLLEQGEPAAARRQLDRAGDSGDRSEGARYWRNAQLELLIAEREFERAVAIADDFAGRFAHVHNPVDTPWRSHKARALHALQRSDEAVELAAEDLNLARRWGAPGSLARALRVLGTIERAAGCNHLREAIATAAGSPARLEHAKALAALGRSLRHTGHEREAREPLREAIDLAYLCGARSLVEHSQAELHAAGGRRRSPGLKGVQALTPSEHRIARLAARGASNREIAQELFVTPKTVEMHLGNTYRKLDIGSRRELAAAIGDQ